MSEIKPSEVTSILRQQLQHLDLSTEMAETGTVLLVGDGIARVYGLQNVKSGELVTISSAISRLFLAEGVFTLPIKA